MLGEAQPLTGPVPSWVVGYADQTQEPAYDLKAAEAARDKAGYGPGELELSLIYFNGLTWQQTVAGIIQRSLDEIGVKLNVEGAPWATLTKKVASPDTRPDLGMVSVSPPTRTADTQLHSLIDPSLEGHWTYWGYQDKAVINALHAAQAEPDAAKQETQLVALQETLVDQYTAAWMMEIPDVYVMQSSVKAVKHDPTWGRVLDYYGMYKEE